MAEAGRRLPSKHKTVGDWLLALPDEALATTERSVVCVGSAKTAFERWYASTRALVVESSLSDKTPTLRRLTSSACVQLASAFLTLARLIVTLASVLYNDTAG